MLGTRKQTSAQKALLAERIQKLIRALSDGVYEREDTMKLCLLAALSGESVFLLGPPGIAKSLIAKRLIKAFDNSSYFEYLMTRFSTPEEVFGPLSIQELKDNGKYVRLIDGYLPTAQVVFLDEIWKAGPAILNTLLTVVNEKTFKNGSEVLPVPMRLLVSASNELPDEDSGLDALYDRMLVRVFVNRIQDKNNFKSMLTMETPQETELPEGLAITDLEYVQWQQDLEKLELPEAIFEKLYQLKSMLEERAESGDMEGCEMDLYVSDRRWKKAVKLLKASAFFNGRDAINPMDLLLLQDCLWNSPESRQMVRSVIRQFATEHAFEQSKVRSLVLDAKLELEDLEKEITTSLGITYNHETPAGIMRKESFSYDFSGAKRYSVGSAHNLIKLVMLQGNMSVSESEKGDSRWVYVNADDLDKKMKEEGSCEVYGYVNMNPSLCMLRFELDASEQLVIKDIANRSILVGLCGKQGPTIEQQNRWQHSGQMALDKLNEAQHALRSSRSSFQGALPHLFVEEDLPHLMESSIQDLATTVESTKKSIEKVAQRVTKIGEFFL